MDTQKQIKVHRNFLKGYNVSQMTGIQRVKITEMTLDPFNECYSEFMHNGERVKTPKTIILTVDDIVIERMPNQKVAAIYIL